MQENTKSGSYLLIQVVARLAFYALACVVAASLVSGLYVVVNK